MSKQSLRKSPTRRRPFMQMVGLVLIIIALAACAAPAPAATPPSAVGEATAADGLSGSVTVFNQGGEKAVAVNAKAIEQLNEQHPNIVVEDLYNPVPSWGEYINSIKLRVAGGQDVDVIYVAIEGAQELIFQDLLMPIDDIIESDPELQQLVDQTEPVLHDALKGPDGSTYFLTREWNNMVIHYNPEIFEAAGVEPPSPDWTWEDFLDAAIKTTSGEGDNKIWGFAIPYFNFGLAPWFHTNGTSTLNEDWTDSNLDDPKVLESVEFVHSLIHEYGVSPAVAGTDPYGLFQSGHAAMTGAGRWPVLGYLDAGFTTVDIAPWPQKETGTTVFGSGGYAIRKGSPNVDAAVEVIKALLSDQTQLEFTNLYTSLPATRIVTDNNPDFNKMPPSAHFFFDSLVDIKPIPAPANFSEVEGIFMRNMDLIMGGSVTPEEGLAKADKELSEAMATLKERMAK